MAGSTGGAGVSKAAPTPWRMEKAREGQAAIFGANGVLVGVVSEVNARLIVEGVNDRAWVERVVYRFDAEQIARDGREDLRNGL
jgi:hypothetical protein